MQRIANSLAARLRSVRGHVLTNGSALREALAERRGHPVEPDHGPHLSAALDWLIRAQDATPDDGFARGYSVTWNPYFRARGWQASYPETTGYIIPTLYLAEGHLGGDGALADRAERAARWEAQIQLPSGAVKGGVIGQGTSPSVFNTGQVIFGWLAAFRHSGDEAFASAAARAASFLISALDEDGHWRRGNSKFARGDATNYNARTAWALAEAGAHLGEKRFTAGAARALRAVARLQHANGWIPDCCLSDPERPLLHTLAYALRGLLEGGTVLEDEELIAAAARASERLAEMVRPDGWLAGRYDRSWAPSAEWSCLTGEAQMANVWLRLHGLTGEEKWLEPVPPVLRFLKGTQSRTSRDPGVNGGIKGSAPMAGGYGRYQILNWATKFFIDALIRHERAARRGDTPELETERLA